MRRKLGAARRSEEVLGSPVHFGRGKGNRGRKRLNPSESKDGGSRRCIVTALLVAWLPYVAL